LKTILITGASSGIGRALAVQAARTGFNVYAVGRNVRALAALAGQIGEEGGTIVTDVTDISDPATAPGLIGRAVGAFGHVDILVNNAGAAATGPIAMQTDEQLRNQFGTHVLGPLALTREALPTLRASRGHVFMIGSGVARVPVGGMGAYPPSKAALRSATSILRRELISLDIAVTYVDPGAVDTGFMTRAGMPGAPRDVLISPELVARKILMAIPTRPRVVNAAPLQTAAVAIAEVFPGIAEAVMELRPNLIGTGPSLAAIEVARDTNGRGEKIALPSARGLPSAPENAAPANSTPPSDETPATNVLLEPPTTPPDEAPQNAAPTEPLAPPDETQADLFIPPVSSKTDDPVGAPVAQSDVLPEPPTTPPNEAPVNVAPTEPLAPPDETPAGLFIGRATPASDQTPDAEAVMAEFLPKPVDAAFAVRLLEASDAAEPPYVQPPVRWQYEPPESTLDGAAGATPPAAPTPAATAEPAAIPAANAPSVGADAAPLAVAADADADDDDGAFPPLEPTEKHDVIPSATGSSFDAALEPLLRRMERAKLTTDFVRAQLIVDSVIDVGDAAMRWAGMPNKHERALTSEVFFALSEWGFLAPRSDGRYRVLYPADGDPVV
jgi:short-subunit dehydrogenase